MIKNAQKGLKPLVFKVLIITMSICYVFGPAHIQISNVLHTISHNLKVPSFVIQHDKKDFINYQVHSSLHYESDSHKFDHRHEVIDFIDVIFNAASNEGDNHQGESSVFEIKINEHISSEKYTFPLKNGKYKASHIFCKTFRYSHGGYLEQLFRPPKV
jgi:hypothetical protein